ncbi:hypothetical protein K7640_27175 [Micromonospora sp. PLK6-60]|uniref:peptidase MA family metallohydrolase n=1 Tax=Micromonospora sp. PLK6-60 TaxID=2873383 RepID=UPI001CA68133|nr:hypothetical protein [Micromonospora sp. PLK6-60]MBY8875520.1 hypothetical protein [Micromonospora sp. PLK6-60]
MVTVLLLLTVTVVVAQDYLAEQQAKRDAKYAAAEEALNPIKQQEVDALLAGQTKALKDRDEKAFLATFDPAYAKLVNQQRSLFRNLVKVPFAEATFKRLGGGSAVKPLGTGASFTQRVAFVHKIDGFDLHPVDEQYDWTIARTEKGAPLKVTAVKGNTSDWGAATYYPAPWDKWRDIHVERTEHTLFIVNASLKSQARRYAPQAERAAAANLDAWRAGGVSGEIPQGFVISLVKGKKDLGSLYRVAKEPPPEAGFSWGVPRYQDIDASTDEKAPDTGGSRVVIDLASPFFRPSERSGPGEIFRHELAHSLVTALAAQQPDSVVPRESWVVEGFAEYLGNERKPWTASPRTASAKQSLRSGYSVSLKPEFNMANGESANLSYWCGHSAIGYIVEKYGERKAFEVVAAHYRGKELKDALPDVLGVSYPDFTTSWEAYVMAKIR